MKKFKKYVLLTGFLFLLAMLPMACNLIKSRNKADKDFVKEVPDHTIFVASVLEATTDTAQHYPEVYVGSVVHKYKVFRGKRFLETIHGIWWPVLNAQVNKTTRRTDLVRTDINDANVSITGPLHTPQEQKVNFISQGLGDYGDRQYNLQLVPKGTYRLDVQLKDGRHYRSITTLPALPIWHTPDTLQVKLKLQYFGDGNYIERNISEKQLRLPYTPSGWMTTGHINYKGVKISLTPGQYGTLYDEQGPYLRNGSNYLIRTNSSFPDENHYGPVWIKGSDMPLKNKMLTYMRLSGLNKDLSKQWLYENIYRFIGSQSSDFWSKKDTQFTNAYFGNDRTSTFLFEDSNILKVGKDGKTLPKAQTDAIGVFGGRSTVYHTMVLKPIRSWDPDTLNWGPNNS